MTTSETRFDPGLRNMSLVVALGAIMTVLDTTIVNVAITVLGRDLHTSLSTIQWVLTGYTLALSMTIPISGWAVERFGSKTAWVTSLALFIVGSVLCGAAWSPGSLIAFRILQGVGGGLLMPVGQMMLARAAGPERMGRVMAVVSVPAMLAPALGPVLGGVLLDHLAWRWMFYINVPICAAALILAVRLLPADPQRDTTKRLDVLGLALLSPGLAAAVFGLAQAGEGQSLTGARVLLPLAVALVLLVAFGARAMRKPGSLVDLRLFGNRAFSASVGAIFLYSIAMFGVLILVPLYDQTVRGGDTLDAGLLIAPLGVGGIITMVLAGRLTDRFGSRLPALAGLAIVLAGTAFYTQVSATSNLASLAAGAFVVGLGHGLIVVSIMAGAYQGIAKTAIPASTTTANILIRVGSALGAAILAVVLQILIRSAIPGSNGVPVPGHSDELASAFAGSFWWAFGIAAVSLIPALLLPRRTSKAATPSAPSAPSASAQPAQSVDGVVTA